LNTHEETFYDPYTEMMTGNSEENKSITYKVIDGEIAKNYKVFKSTAQVTPKGNGCLVKWTIEYEKAYEDVPTPNKYNDFTANMSKAVEAYLLNA
jgi:hypothetical protein